MTEQNWATREAYLWLANDEGAYNEIMATPPDDRLRIIWAILKNFVIDGAMGDFTEKDLKDVSFTSLAADFADTPRYEHDCRACTFLARHGKYDLYQHSDGISDFILARVDDGENFIWRKPEVEALLVGLKLSNWNLEAQDERK